MTTVTARPATLSATERALLALEAFLALGAYGGAIALIVGGVDLGEATASLPFGSTLFAGIALGIVNGLLPTAVLVGALRRQPWARTGHWLVGAALTVWIVVQVGFLGWPPHWLQVLYFSYGLAILALARLVPRQSVSSLPGTAARHRCAMRAPPSQSAAHHHGCRGELQ